MKFRVLQDNLRDTLWERIDEGDLTGLRLAQQTGFKQAHISNFLNRKRGLSLEGMDRVLAVQHLSVLDLLNPSEVNKRASILPPSDDDFHFCSRKVLPQDAENGFLDITLVVVCVDQDRDCRCAHVSLSPSRRHLACVPDSINTIQ